MSEKKKIPTHVAIIMDGNGRWAKQRGKERYEGHIAGVDAVRRSVRAASDMGVKYLTFYAFSTENWQRPQQEVDALMELLSRSIVSETPDLVKQGVKVKFIGDASRFSDEVRSRFEMMERETSRGDVMTMILALNYSSRDEITRAVQGMAQRIERGEISAKDVNEALISNSLDTAAIPDPDLIIRTSGECRLSNFLLWQASYAEFYFPEVLWPDFDKSHFVEALEVYVGRNRRYGKL
ncbi:MAG: isoprenyl transferase [Rikenellaceae bacterium]